MMSVLKELFPDLAGEQLRELAECQWQRLLEQELIAKLNEQLQREINRRVQLEATLREKEDSTVRLQNTVAELEQRVVELSRDLETEKENNELKTRFISMVSHDLRTPLATILISSDLLKSFGAKLGADKRQQQLNKIQTAVKQMNQLMEDVLVMGKTSSNKMELHPLVLNLEAFSREVLEEISVSAGEKHTLVFDCQRICHEGECSLFEIDEKILRTILTNLLSNAVKYSPEGGIVRLNLVLEDSQAIFQVQDSGIGIPDKDKEHLFEVFHRASNVGKISGTGLGLAIIKQAVELHGGSISVESQVGVGTNFTVCIPTHQPSD